LKASLGRQSSSSTWPLQLVVSRARKVPSTTPSTSALTTRTPWRWS